MTRDLHWQDPEKQEWYTLAAHLEKYLLLTRSSHIDVSIRYEYAWSQKSNRLSGILGLYLYARRTPSRAITTLSHIGICTSASTIERGVNVLRNDALVLARKVAHDPITPWMSVHDNLQFRLDVGQTTISNFSRILHTTTAIITPMFNTAK